MSSIFDTSRKRRSKRICKLNTRVQSSYFCDFFSTNLRPQIFAAVVAVILWWLDLQLYMQALSITTDVVGSNPTQGEVYNIV